MPEQQAGPAAGYGLPPASVTAWLRASCERQGVPVLVRDPAVLAQVAALLGRHPVSRPRTEPNRRASRDRSQPPLGPDTVDVHGSGPRAPGSDDGVIEDGLHDGLPAVQPEGLPLGA